jgi:hypothetical protein
VTGSDKSADTKPLADLAAPFGQKIELFDASPAADVRLMRVRIRERSRFTVFDIDPATADAWGNALKDWAKATGALDTKGSGDE